MTVVTVAPPPVAFVHPPAVKVVALSKEKVLLQALTLVPVIRTDCPGFAEVLLLTRIQA